jgi:mRNA-degrading endonuclease toxin of MazEF toxin-antitoxin module
MATTLSARRRPAPGDILPYSFLWSHEFDFGRDEAVKQRPCVVVLAVGPGENPTVTVAPITSREPELPGAIPLRPSAHGLDRASWIIPRELNTFRWLGPDVGAAPRPFGAWWRLGALSPDLRRRLRESVETALVARRPRIQRRSE